MARFGMGWRRSSRFCCGVRHRGGDRCAAKRTGFGNPCHRSACFIGVDYQPRRCVARWDNGTLRISIWRPIGVDFQPPAVRCPLGQRHPTNTNTPSDRCCVGCVSAQQNAPIWEPMPSIGLHHRSRLPTPGGALPVGTTAPYESPIRSRSESRRVRFCAAKRTGFGNPCHRSD
jgi:hypothetical protein